MRPRNPSSLRRLLPVMLFACLAWLPPAFADSNAEQAYDDGVAAFEDGEFEVALSHFRTAQSLGLDSPQLHYNLGVSHYRLGDFATAREEFEQAARSPEFAALARFNLGLTALQLEDTDGAVAQFLEVFALTDSRQLHSLATTMLQRIDPDHVAGEPAPWSGFVSAGPGYDDNVMLLPDDHFLGGSERSDYYLDVFAHGWRSIELAGTGRSLELDASLWLLRHSELAAFDTSLLRAGGGLGQEAGNWELGATGHMAFTLLDAEPLSRESLINLRAATRLPSGPLRLRYELGRIDALDDAFSYLDGWRHRLDARMTWPHRGARMHLVYQFEFNDREDLESPLFTSFSPVRNALRLIADMPLGKRFELHAEAQYDRSRYRRPNRLEDDTEVVRIDDRLSITGRLSYSLSAGSEAFIEYRYVDNDSSIDLYDYSRNRLQTGMLLLF